MRKDRLIYRKIYAVAGTSQNWENGRITHPARALDNCRKLPRGSSVADRLGKSGLVVYYSSKGRKGLFFLVP